MQNQQLSIIIPVFNEVKTIETAIAQIKALPLDCELIVVDDCSTDGTRELLQKLQKSNDFLLLLQKQNSGKGAAVSLGIEQAHGIYFIVEDADLELDTKIIPNLLERISAAPNIDMISCYRVVPKSYRQHFVSDLARIVTKIVMKLLYFKSTKDVLCSYKMCKVAKFKELQIKSTRFGLETEWVVKALKGNWKILELPVDYYPRAKKAGKKIRFLDGFDIIWQLIRFRF